MQHLGPECPSGKWIMIISELEQQRHEGLHPHIRSISGDAHSPSVLLSVLQEPLKHICSFEATAFNVKTKIRNSSGPDI